MVEDPTNDSQQSSPAKKKRGGKRPGAGAPKGNMNALKTGAYSKQFAELGRLLASDPKIQVVLLDIGARAGRKFKKANEAAAFLLTQWAEQVERNAEAKYAPKGLKRRRQNGDGLSLQLPVDDWDSIKEAGANYARKMRK